MKSDIDHQQFHSIFNKAAALLNHQNIEYPCELIDISLHGCLLRFKNTAGSRYFCESLFWASQPKQAAKT
ncbi:hypothetical protein BMR05_07995 [Methylococcaceae bacterium HT4]|nr:hypothetical protein BMR05_07995 [Methylococcaceae bacterium HT4]